MKQRSWYANCFVHPWGHGSGHVNGAKTALVVDDDESLAFIIREILEVAGFVVWIAHDGWQGYRSAVAVKPELIIADIQLPGKNGMEMMSRIRMKHSSVKTIYMSGEWSRFQKQLEEEKDEYGVVFLRKPFCKRDLLELVTDCLTPRDAENFRENGSTQSGVRLPLRRTRSRKC